MPDVKHVPQDREDSWLKKLGPGLITGAADDDPSGIATYSQAGAQFGFNMLWTVLFTYPLMVGIQVVSARIGRVSGHGLATNIRKHYPAWLLYSVVGLLLIANTINIGADLGAMAASAQMLLGLPYLFWLILMTGFIIALEIFVTYKAYSKILKYLGLSLLAYVLTAFIVKPDWGIIAKSTVLPQIQFSGDYILNVVAILGTTISPYLFFWQASEEVEEEISDGKVVDMGVGKPRVTKKNVAGMDWDTNVGMLFSQAIMFFIIITTAATLHANGITNIATASQAAEALRPVAGDLAYLLFAVGIIGTGLLAVPILAGSSAYAVSETMGMREGLSKKTRLAPGFYGVIAASTFVGMLISWLGIDPIKALYYAAALNGLTAPPLMVLIILIANNKKIMGRHVNKKLSKILGWVIVLVMSIAGILLIVNMIKGTVIK